MEEFLVVAFARDEGKGELYATVYKDIPVRGTLGGLHIINNITGEKAVQLQNILKGE